MTGLFGPCALSLVVGAPDLDAADYAKVDLIDST